MRNAVRIACLLLIAACPAVAQEVLFDQMVEAGGLKCYPVHGDPTSWYYLPDQPHVATTGEGERPQFSFLMYTTPEQRGEEGITTAPGGGVAHMLVAYDVPEDMVRRAQSELQRQQPGAQLKGPVSYTDGTFNLVTAVTDPEAGLMRRVVGVGNAPVMSGHKAAVSMHLTPTGAMLLWESFSQRTPDISVNFEMTVSGYRNPVDARMTFNYERIHQTMELEAGIESRYLEADVEVMLGKMVDNGAITIELKGAPPEQWAEVQKLGLELAKHHLFENLGAAPLSQVADTAREAQSGSRSRSGGSTGSRSDGDPAVDGSSGNRGSDGRDESQGSGPGALEGRSDHFAAVGKTRFERIEIFALPPDGDEDETEARQALEAAQELYRDGRFREAVDRLDQAMVTSLAPNHFLWEALCLLRLGEQANALAALDEWVEEDHVSSDVVDAAIAAIREAPSSAFTSAPQARQMRTELADRLLDASRSATGGGSAAAADRPSGAASTSGDDREGEPSRPAAGIRDEITRDDDLPLRTPEFEDADEPELRRIAPSDRRQPRPSDEREEDPVRVTVSFKMRRIDRSGSFTFNMKQWNRIELPVRFAANVGDLSRYRDDPRMFRRVSLNDPMFKQREIPVTVDVASEQAFAAMLNAVTVTLRKRHQSGRETVDEVTVQRADFASGAVETLFYGWDGDDNRTTWLDYDRRVRWNYVGGPVIETDWQETSAGALVLSPPIRARELTLEADSVLLREQGVRDVVVQVRYLAAGTERTAKGTFRPSDGVGRQILVLYQDPQQPDYSYRFDWRLFGGRRVEAGPFDEFADTIYLDEIPR
jgi:hypothetical protein